MSVVYAAGFEYQDSNATEFKSNLSRMTVSLSNGLASIIFNKCIVVDHGVRGLFIV